MYIDAMIPTRRPAMGIGEDLMQVIPPLANEFI